MDPLRLSEVADIVGGRCVGDATHAVTGIAPVDESESHHIAFLAAERYVRYVAECRAGAYLVAEALLEAVPAGGNAVVVDDPYPALQRLLIHLYPHPEVPAQVHPSAVIGEGVTLGPGVSIGPYAVLESGVAVGARTSIGPHVVLGARTTLGADCRIHPHVVAYHDTIIGDRVEIHAGARLGADGFGYTQIDGEHRKIPQVGRCVIGDGVEIGANSTIDRGSLGDTRIGEGVKLDNLVHIAHNVRVGAGTLMAALVGIAGSTRIGRGVWMGGQSGAINQLDIGDGVKVTVQAGVTGDVPAGETMFGFPARPHREGLRREASVGRLPQLKARVVTLEAEVRRLGALLDDDGRDGE